eukprot:PhM_4_TR14551/c0_g2_i1/m.106928/K00057/gpsA; glycerol-3-phosphate dehydrogenase (NAD(P)+)
MSIPVSKATVVGGGSFGTALGLVLARKGAEVVIWVRDAAQAKAVNDARENARYLPGTPLPSNLTFTSDIAAAVFESALILLAIPSQFLRAFLVNNRSTFPIDVPLVLCAKGIEVSSLQTPYDILQDELPGKYARSMAVLAGPSFAKEMAAGLPTAVVIASAQHSLAEKVQCQLSSTSAHFRCYTSDDMMGCEIAGAVKNVLAIASGASSGLGLGVNARAALICRGLSEMTTLAKKLGSNGRAMSGLAGIGDLQLTCSSEMSRNFSVGKKLAESGKTLEEIVGGMSAVAEGVATAKAIHELCVKHGIEMPICQEVYAVLYEKKSVLHAMTHLEERPLNTEH